MKWVNNGNTQKSEAEVDKLVNDVLLSSHFNQEDLERVQLPFREQSDGCSRLSG